MIYRLTVPLTIEQNTEVRVLEWHVAAGDRLRAGTLLVELETHKALIEVRADQTGIMRERRVDAESWCPLGGLLALVSDNIDEPLTEGEQAMAADFLIG
ncbi:lipoyl domain-containing protein [Novosphingobium lentum]|uniref:lipoyl domain-containing protein n=1 Tax=Novosphingobium lentum TaxID=145287 RepID=UPI000834A87D|nr:lipoyl domain-containing protein [Novosphingobium lentum]